ncbi:MAG: helicase-related protein [Pseudonocardiaceae bacterium]
MTLPAPDVDAVAIAAAKSKVGAGGAGHARRRPSSRPGAVTLLSALKDVAGRGVRLNQLERAGFRTVADLLHAPVHALHAVPGVGPQTVQQAVDAARLAAAQVHRDTRFRFDPDRRDPGQTQLLATLAAIRAADSTTASLSQPLQVFTTQTAPLVVEAERAASRLKMLLPGRAKKNAALRALAQLDAILVDPRIHLLQEAVRQRERAVDPNAYEPAQLWQEYATDAASVNAVLSTVGAQPDLDDGRATDALAGASAFRRAVAPVYLRRNQEDVLTELPEKIEVEDWVQLSSEDVTAYASAVRSRNLMEMRQAAFRSPRSAKLERLLEIVEEAAEDGMEVVVFSYFRAVLATVGRALGASVAGEINWSVAPVVRQQIVDDFTRLHGHAVLLGQIEAGGVGSNMQAASVVVIAEPQWKPSTENQAVAERCKGRGPSSRRHR